MQSVKVILLRSVFIITTTFSLAACSTLQTTTLPMRDGNYKIIATAESSSEARSGAAKEAQAVCAKQGTSFKAIQMNTVYQGAGKQLEALSSIASNVAWTTSKTMVPSTKSAEDYQTTLVFSCN